MLIRFIELAVNVVRWLAIPLAILLALQWPLRDWIGAYSRLTNDIAQIVFAVYIGVAITATTLAGAHFSAHRIKSHGALDWRRCLLLACVVPWACLVLWSSALPAWASTISLERFGETGHPGFFVLKCAVVVLALFVIIEMLLKMPKKQ